MLGSLDDPDGRITVTADGLLEVMKTKRVQPKAKKGHPPPPPKVTHDTALVDLQGKTIKLAANTVVGELFLTQRSPRSSLQRRRPCSTSYAHPTRRWRAARPTTLT